VLVIQLSAVDVPDDELPSIDLYCGVDSFAWSVAPISRRGYRSFPEITRPSTAHASMISAFDGIDV
jgi:hypothetical protein